MSMVYSNGLVERLENAVSTLDETASVQIIHNSPYPVVDIYVDGTEALGDVPYRATTGLIDLPISTTVGIARTMLSLQVFHFHWYQVGIM